MRSREQAIHNLLEAAHPSEPDKYLLRLLKVGLLTAELLVDVRELLTEIRNQSKSVVVDFVPPDYGKEDHL